MNAKQIKQERNAINYDNKELIKYMEVIGKGPGRAPKSLITARFYMSKSGDGASPIYCSLWIHEESSGTGKATGFGYHKGSAALAAAIKSAGWELSEDIAGVGNEAMRDALEAIAQALGHKHVLIVGG